MAGIERFDVHCYTALLSQKSVVCKGMRRFVCGLLCPKTEQSPYDRIASGKGTFINSPQKGEIKIVKTSYDNKAEGIHFEVTGKTYTGQTFKKTYTTDKNGIIRIKDLRAGEYTIHEVKDEASAGYLLPKDKQLTIDRDGAMLVAEMHNSKLPDNPPTGASEDSFTQTAVIIISMVMMSAAVVLVFPLSKRKKRNR